MIYLHKLFTTCCFTLKFILALQDDQTFALLNLFVNNDEMMACVNPEYSRMTTNDNIYHLL